MITDTFKNLCTDTIRWAIGLAIFGGIPFGIALTIWTGMPWGFLIMPVIVFMLAVIVNAAIVLAIIIYEFLIKPLWHWCFHGGRPYDV